MIKLKVAKLYIFTPIGRSIFKSTEFWWNIGPKMIEVVSKNGRKRYWFPMNQVIECYEETYYES